MSELDWAAETLLHQKHNHLSIARCGSRCASCEVENAGRIVLSLLEQIKRERDEAWAVLAEAWKCFAELDRSIFGMQDARHGDQETWELAVGEVKRAVGATHDALVAAQSGQPGGESE